MAILYFTNRRVLLWEAPGFSGPGKLWSLWNIMMNFGVFGLCRLLADLALKERSLGVRIQAQIDLSAGPAAQFRKYIDPSIAGQWDTVNDNDLRHVKGWLEYSRHLANGLEMQPVHDRIDIFLRKLQFDRLSLHDLVAEIRALRETFEAGLPFKRFYLYPALKGEMCIKAQADWAKAIAGFPKIKDDALAAVDCYGLGHNTASVFYSMRVVEHGIREFAAAVNIVFDVQQWQTVIEQIESEIREIDRRWSKSTAKSEWIGFYSEAAKEFFYFKAGWRNYVSHGHDPYNEHEAVGVLEHVRAFMTHLASRLGDTSTAPPS